MLAPLPVLFSLIASIRALLYNTRGAILIVILFAAKKNAQKGASHPETYVCDICSENECVCHKEHVDTKA